MLGGYGHLSGRQLSHLAHSEGPWTEARRGLSTTARSENEIPVDEIHEYYSALDADDEAVSVDDVDWSSFES